jgi:single-strand DNA-binding protein
MEMLVIAGNVGRDGELRRTGSGDPVLNFSMAVDQGKDKSGNKRDAKWFDCALWGKRAESLASHITKGTKLTVSGRVTAREHNGKVYLGCNVQELTFMGGGQQRDDSGYPDSPGGSAYGASTGGAGGHNDMDDEIPFAVDMRL